MKRTITTNNNNNNNLRVFAFQFYNNSLVTNTRLAALYRADPVVRINDGCAFCIAGGLAVPAREDFFHVFFQCPVIRDCINKYVERYSSINDLNDNVRNKALFSQVQQTDGDLKQWLRFSKTLYSCMVSGSAN
jgi:hypothetical protein